jgi:hypothetical protein
MLDQYFPGFNDLFPVSLISQEFTADHIIFFLSQHAV